MDPTSADALIQLLEQVIEIYGRPDNGASWAGYRTEEEAAEELRAHIGYLQARDFSHLTDLTVLFLPTGPIEDIAHYGGWMFEYQVLAQEFDRLLGRPRRRT